MTTTAGGALVLSPLLVGSLSGKKAEAQEKAGRVIPFSLRVGILPGASYGVQREVWAYNGQVPGPLIRATEGDMLRIRVKNELARPTTIHWHGVHQINCSIAPPTPHQAPGDACRTPRQFLRRAVPLP